MELNDIENKIACNKMTATQVFTQMKQHIDAANKDGYNNAVLDIVDFTTGMDVEAETIKEQFLCV